MQSMDVAAVLQEAVDADLRLAPDCNKFKVSISALLPHAHP